MRVRMGPAKREGNHRLIFDQELSGKELISRSNAEVAISITADPLHRKSGYRDNSRYCYEIILSATEVAQLMKRVTVRGDRSNENACCAGDTAANARSAPL